MARSFVLQINVDRTDKEVTEVRRIIKDIANRLYHEDFEVYTTLYDSRGNDVGRCAFKDNVAITEISNIKHHNLKED